MKIICFEYVQYIWAEDIFTFEVGDIIDGDKKIFRQVTVMSLCNWRKYFMTLAEFREKQINDILNEES